MWRGVSSGTTPLKAEFDTGMDPAENLLCKPGLEEADDDDDEDDEQLLFSTTSALVRSKEEDSFLSSSFSTWFSEFATWASKAGVKSSDVGSSGFVSGCLIKLLLVAIGVATLAGSIIK